MSHSRSQRKTLPYWLTLLVGVVLSCLLMNLITVSSQLGTFSSWASLNSPPSGAKRLIDAQFNQIWVEAHDGRFFTASILFNCEGKDMCWEWEAIDEIPKMHEPYFPVIRGNDCEKLRDGASPSNPKGQVIECLYAQFPGPEFGEEGYFALMADGDVLYWHNGGSIIATQVLFIVSTFVIPFIVAIVISGIYLIAHLINRASKERTNAIQKAG